MRIKDTGVASDKDLGTCTERILNGSLLGAMKIIYKSEVEFLDSDMTESQVMSDLMSDFPPMSREDHQVVIEEVVAQHLKNIGVAIAWEQIPIKAYAPQKVIRRKRKQTKSDDEEEEEEKPKKQAKKAKAFKSAAFNIQKEVAELNPA